MHATVQLQPACRQEAQQLQFTHPVVTACRLNKELSQTQRKGVLLMARLWRLEHDKGPDGQPGQLAACSQLLLMEMRMAGVADSACNEAACEALSTLDGSGQHAAGFRRLQLPG